MANTYDIGDKARITLALTVDDVATDPSGLSFILRNPAGTLTTYVYGTDAQLEKTGTGAYRVDYSLTGVAPGIYRYRWVATGTGQGAEEGWFEVRPTLTS